MRGGELREGKTNVWNSERKVDSPMYGLMMKWANGIRVDSWMCGEG